MSPVGCPVGCLAEPGTLLSAWERAAGAPATVRPVVLAAAAGLVHDPEAGLDLSVGQVAELAATVYRASFGDTVDCLADCDACGAALDVSLPLTALPSAPDQPTRELPAAGSTLVLRAPSVRDLLAAAVSDDPAASLFEACVSGPDGSTPDPSAYPDHLLEDLDSAADELAGPAALVVRTRCPACGTDVRTPVDVGALLWDRVAAAAPAHLAEVAELAAALGWREADILALSEPRRQGYLALVRGGVR